MHCVGEYKRYKRVCGYVNEFIKYNTNNVQMMSASELNAYLQVVRKQFKHTRKCADMRIEYRDKCVEESKQDKGHEKAIEIAERMHRDSELELERIAARFRVLDAEIEKEQVSEEKEELQEKPSVNQKKKKKQTKKSAKSQSSESRPSKQNVTDEIEYWVEKLKLKDNDPIQRKDEDTARVERLEEAFERFKIPSSWQFIMVSYLYIKDHVRELGDTSLDKYIDNLTINELLRVTFRVLKTVHISGGRDAYKYADDMCFFKLRVNGTDIPVSCNAYFKASQLYTTLNSILLDKAPPVDCFIDEVRLSKSKRDMYEIVGHEDVVVLDFYDKKDVLKNCKMLYAILKRDPIQRKFIQASMSLYDNFVIDEKWFENSNVDGEQMYIDASQKANFDTIITVLQDRPKLQRKS